MLTQVDLEGKVQSEVSVLQVLGIQSSLSTEGWILLERNMKKNDMNTLLSDQNCKKLQNSHLLNDTYKKPDKQTNKKMKKNLQNNNNKQKNQHCSKCVFFLYVNTCIPFSCCSFD